MSDKPPNILFFFPDQHRSDWLGGSADLPLRTPNLDRLASGGTRFTRAYCTSPLCAPSRASLASGRCYDRCGVVNNDQDLPLSQPTYYRALRDAGYRVAGVGKFDLHKATLDWGLDGSHLLEEWGFTGGIDNEGKIDGSRSYTGGGNRPQGPYLQFLHERGLADDYVAEHDRERRRACSDAYVTGLPDDAYCDNWLSENGLRFLREFPADSPWHLVVNFTGPHNPMEVTASMRARWESVRLPPPHNNDHPDPRGVLRARQNYAAMIENIDRQVGRFVDAVRERGELDRTLIVYASDHGEMLGDHGLWGKSTWRDPACRVPLIVSGPGVARGAVSDALVSLQDLAATFIEICRVEQLPGMDARSLVGILAGRTDRHRDAVVCGLNDWRMAFDGRYKLVLDGAAAVLLFDLVEDPFEDRDVAARHPEAVDGLAAAIDGEREGG
jgi:arylsulfatase A-like enzyme